MYRVSKKFGHPYGMRGLVDLYPRHSLEDQMSAHLLCVKTQTQNSNTVTIILYIEWPVICYR